MTPNKVSIQKNAGCHHSTQNESQQASVCMSLPTTADAWRPCEHQGETAVILWKDTRESFNHSLTGYNIDENHKN